MDGSHFSDEMSDEVTIEQQRKEELAAMVPPSEGSVASGSSRRTEQWVEETCRERTNEAEEEWPNSNMTNELAAEEGCSRAPLGEKTSSRLQITVDEGWTRVLPTRGTRVVRDRKGLESLEVTLEFVPMANTRECDHP